MLHLDQENLIRELRKCPEHFDPLLDLIRARAAKRWLRADRKLRRARKVGGENSQLEGAFETADREYDDTGRLVDTVRALIALATDGEG